MLNFPPPPPPPIDSSQLENLANYYRSIVDYYRRASEIASQQLAHVEALLNPNSELMFSSDLESWLDSPETPFPNGNKVLAIGEQPPTLSPTAVQNNGQKDKCSQFSEGDNNQPCVEIFENNPTSSESTKTVVSEETLLFALSSELESNRGKMLHLDYLVRKLRGEIDSDELDKAIEEIKSLLEKGTDLQLWFAVPDSPDCWTIDLSEFPDSISQVNSRANKQSSSPRTTLVGSERLDRYPTVMDALAACLAEHYPNSMTTKQIADWFYPDKLSQQRREKVRTALGKALSAGCDRDWRRVRVGEYIHIQGEK
jgi:hypothetical protein